MRHLASFRNHVQSLFLLVHGALFAQRLRQVADHLLLTVKTPANLAADLPQRELLDRNVVRRLILPRVIAGVQRGVRNVCIDGCQVYVVDAPLAVVLLVVVFNSQLFGFVVACSVL